MEISATSAHPMGRFGLRACHRHHVGPARNRSLQTVECGKLYRKNQTSLFNTCERQIMRANLLLD
jgi:hypothetical protein